MPDSMELIKDRVEEERLAKEAQPDPNRLLGPKLLDSRVVMKPIFDMAK
jgi:hypothetical protein